MEIGRYIRLKRAAEMYDFDVRHLRDMCLKGLIKGASKVDKEWRIPVSAMNEMMEAGIPDRNKEEATNGL